MDLTAFLTAQVTGFVLVFARLGSTFMFMPGFGEALIPLRVRLAFALLLSVALRPAVDVPDTEFANVFQLIFSLGLEVTIGVWIGITARIIMSSIQFAGYQVGLTSGLANAFSNELGSFQGSTLIASALMMAGAALIFASDLHYLIIDALMRSYEVFPLGGMMPGDMAQQILRAGGMSFYIGAMIAAPFFVMSLVLNVGFGLANRMMPTLPVFFIAAPVLIASGLFVLVMASPMMLHVVHDRFADWLNGLVF
ncbi:flagellar biosynthetic protein FliR [Pseudooceanicola nanhaiensis]|uniref:flagellar biosynthetic protein FliR n=1 Tax=Pseudooceanicola nanhaiensis TaxID=375761 RepID=UPI001CD4C8D2|nr:flagellar biosynthetic protein FliR [Pseudooceanicola nanhaiensis]MCA0922662.1 flagellar biosynthetic protein FliR [Pseudooceanicola nanhaiensis]